MKKLVAAVVLAVGFSCVAFADTEKDVMAWYEKYSKPWYEGNVDVETSVSHYAVPGYITVPDSVILMPTAEALKSFHVASIADMKKKGWTGMKRLKTKVKMISPTTALIENEVMAYVADGSPLDGCRVTPYSYLAGRTAEGWKFLSVHFGQCKAR